MWQSHMRGLKHILKIRETRVSLGNIQGDECGSRDLDPALRIALEW
jgi:hypothetical protein